MLTENFVNNSTDFSNFDQMIDVNGIKTKENSFTDVFISKEWEKFVIAQLNLVDGKE